MVTLQATDKLLMTVFFVCILSIRALSRCEEMIQRYSRELHTGRTAVAKAVEDCMRAIIGVLLNLTHDNGQRTLSGRR